MFFLSTSSGHGFGASSLLAFHLLEGTLAIGGFALLVLLDGLFGGFLLLESGDVGGVSASSGESEIGEQTGHVEILMDGQAILEVVWHDALLLVAGLLAGQEEQFAGQVFQHGSQVDGGGLGALAACPVTHSFLDRADAEGLQLGLESQSGLGSTFGLGSGSGVSHFLGGGLSGNFDGGHGEQKIKNSNCARRC